MASDVDAFLDVPLMRLKEQDTQRHAVLFLTGPRGGIKFVAHVARDDALEMAREIVRQLGGDE